MSKLDAAIRLNTDTKKKWTEKFIRNTKISKRLIVAIIRSITEDVPESEFIQSLREKYKAMNQRKIEEYNKKLKEQAKQNKKPLAGNKGQEFQKK